MTETEHVDATRTQSAYKEAMQSRGEEIANAVTHGIGFLFSCTISTTLLVAFASLHGNAYNIVSVSVFGASLMLLYATSCLYHALPPGTTIKHVFRVLDHISIYTLIAGSYTALTLTHLRGPLGWTLFGAEWGLALAGIVFKSVFQFRYATVATFGYLVMGWMVIFAIKPMLQFDGLYWLVIGGLAYTGGVPFFLMDEKRPYFHAIWHVFVMAGSMAHWIMVLLFCTSSGMNTECTSTA
ncbi:channel protein hemolysin III family [Carpediemonas membranifera]|uniref:Channel protein hemolysin III family n=1 Tax=Carpediemonas membranifera TaxID=201153 RepID=A0A8J6B495_9EUKA|nr:channel protein hemolysin III family [Carpediemonas membranifera]|eukprot:KAG9395388.1 channel protein hemolysin III family [Carpediemonas membranifera]